MLHGTVNPNGSATTYYFQWGLTTAYGVQSDEHAAGHGTKPVAVATTASGLIPGTTYHYRLVAVNRAGTTVGADHTLTTTGNPPPSVATGPPTQVGKNSATVSAVIYPNKQATTYYFQYGTSTSYGSQTLAASVAAGTVPVTVTATLTGLEARTIFHYRIVALHGNTAPQADADVTFMTLPRHRPVPSIKARTTPGALGPQAVRVHHLGPDQGTEVDPERVRLPRPGDRDLPARLKDGRLDAAAGGSDLQVLRPDHVRAATAWSRRTGRS